MSYLDQDDPDLVEDLLTRKEFYWLKRWGHKSETVINDIIPRFMLDEEIARSGYLKLLGHQLFIENYFNPNTDYKRLHVKWSTGSGKTLGGLSIAMNFIKNYNIERELGNQEIGSVFIIGFSERAFKNELLKYPEFGFLSREERVRLDKLKRLVAAGSAADKDKYRELSTRVKKRFSNRKGNGFFRFFGYKSFVNRIFIAQPGTNINELSEQEIRIALASGKIAVNESLLAEFKNSLIICDEIHNVYNSAEKNNWGIAIQAVLDREPSVRFVSLSATPLNNSPAEIVDLLNLLLPADKHVDRQDFFINDKDLKPGALEKIAELSRGRFSFLIDVNPKYYPKVLNFGESLKEIPYLKFMRCPMSPFHYKTYKQVYTGALSQDSQYLVDFALPNPEDPNGVGIFQTSQIKKLLPTAQQKFKDKYGIDYKNGKIIGDLLHRKNIANYSSKYAAVMDELLADIKAENGKIFMYHNVVHMSGVLFIEQMLIRNGFLDEFSSSSDNTVCMRCGRTRKEHSKDEIQGGSEESSTPNQALILEDKLIASAIDKKSYYYIPTQSKSLLAGEYLQEFEEFLSSLGKHKPVKVRVFNALGTELIKFLLGQGFELDQHDGIHSTLIHSFGHFSEADHINNYKEDPINEDHIKENPINEDPKKGGNQTKKSNHRFMPARFVLAHSDIDKVQMEHSLERFNSPDNTDGSQFLILVGSKIIKESYDIKALQNEYIISKPDNIPTFIQIRGRAVRKGSHLGLPPEKQVVRIKIFTSCLPVKQETGLDKGKYKLSYEEEKYKEKIYAFQVIQKIERVLHENAIDAIINHEKIQRNMTDDPLGPLPYKPIGTNKFTKELRLDQLNLSTFNVHHAKKEVEILKTLIKRLFIELASVWEYSDLLAAVRQPPVNYETEINTSLFSEENFIIAMSQLVWDNAPGYVEPFIQRQAVTGGADLDNPTKHNKVDNQLIRVLNTPAALKLLKEAIEIQKMQHIYEYFISIVDSEESEDSLYSKMPKLTTDDHQYSADKLTVIIDKMKQIKLAKSSKILDFGGSDGRSVSKLGSKIGTKNIYVVDTYDYPNKAAGVTFKSDLSEFSDCSIDLVSSLMTLHHIEDLEPIIKELHRVAKKWLVIKEHDISVGSIEADVEDVMHNIYIYGNQEDFSNEKLRRLPYKTFDELKNLLEPYFSLVYKSDTKGPENKYYAVFEKISIDELDTDKSDELNRDQAEKNYDLDDPLTTAIGGLQGTYTGGALNTLNTLNNQTSSQIIIDHLFDPADKIIALPGGQDNVIVPIPSGKKQFYVLFPVNSATNVPDIDIEIPYRIIKQEEIRSININSFIQSKRIDFDYDDKKKIFYRKYSDIAIENMQNAVCEYGTTFHIKFVEECIEYVFRAWTDPTLEKHEYHEFYFKMLYYYDLLSLIMWAYTSKPRVFKEYAKYAIPVRAKDIKLKAMAKYENRKEDLDDISPEDNSDLATSGVINLLKSTFNRTSNAWIPKEFRKQYDDTVEKSLSMFAGRKKKNKFITKVSADMLPIGHYISKFPRLYIPDKGWDENPTYLQNEQEYKENNLIVGFDERSSTGVHIRFKIRNPIHNIKKFKDSRQTEKGTVCKSKSKEYLKSVAKKLGAVLPDKVNVEDLCTVIRSKLIRLELKERIKKSNIKYFYFFYEQRPETRHGLLS